MWILCIGFFDFMVAGKKLTDFTGLFSHYGFEINDSMILNCFKDEWKWLKKTWPIKQKFD